MKEEIRNYVVRCVMCQSAKSEALSPVGLLQPLPIPNQIWEDISMDFIGGLPKSEGRDTIFVVVDILSKHAHFCALTHPFSAKSVVKLFVQEIVRLHGVP